MGKAKPYLAGTQPLSDLLLLHQDQYHVFNDWVQSHCMLTPLEHTVHLKKTQQQSGQRPSIDAS